MILALDTVFEQCSVALLKDQMVIGEATIQGNRGQTETILPMIDELLKNKHITFHDIDVLAFNRGPGAFSGIRINTAVAQALAFAHDLPCLPVSSLQALAQQALIEKGLNHVYAVLDARMNQVYFGEFCAKDNVMQLVNDEKLLDYGEKTDKNLPLVGDGATLLNPIEYQICLANIQPTAKTIGLLGLELLNNGKAVTAENALPVYLRHNAWKTLAEQGKK